MTLGILEDTFLDLGPEFWAVAVVVALIVIELFQLGPHSFASSSKGKQKKEDKPHSKSVGVAKGKRKADDIPPFNKTLFHNLVIINNNIGEKDALLYVGEGEGDFMRVPQAASSVSSGDESASKCSQTDNYVICRGDDDPVASIVRQLLPLWASKDREDAKHVVIYSRKVPSTYAVQKVAATLKSYVKRVSVSVFYSEEEDGEEGSSVQDKIDHLRRHNIAMERI